eukprot:812853-Prymnesium_polylepis.1
MLQESTILGTCQNVSISCSPSESLRPTAGEGNFNRRIAPDRTRSRSDTRKIPSRSGVGEGGGATLQCGGFSKLGSL